MTGFHSRRHFFQLAAISTLGLMASSCGTLLYPERRGQPAGRLDWKVVMLNGIGLLFFFLPGVIAFAVDFVNGTIYLPPDEYSKNGDALKKSSLVAVPVSKDQLDRDGIEAVVSAHIQQKVTLEEGNFVAQQIESVDQFWSTWDDFKGHSMAHPEFQLQAG